MQKLIKGIHRFQKESFQPLRRLFEKLAHEQNPETLFITCSDSRIDPCLLTKSKPGDLFILRNAGNIVPARNAGCSGEAATIEFAVLGLGVRDVIICGHSHCGAMTCVLDQELSATMPSVATWLRHAEQTRHIIEQNYAHLSGNALLTAAIEENVLVQLEHLRTLPAVAARLEKGDLHLHGWVYKIETGEVFGYDVEAGQFIPIAEYRHAVTDTAQRLTTSHII